MAGDALKPATDPAGEVEAYLAALERALPGPRRARADVCDEVGDGLLAASDRHRARGMPAAVATRAAVAEFGPPESVAAAFAGELATARARRLLARLLFTGPLVGVWWLLLLAPRWPLDPAGLWAAIPVLPVVAATVVAAASVLAATGRRAHRLPRLTPRRTLLAVRAVTAVCIGVDLAMLTLLVALAVTAPVPHPTALMLAAATASLLRLPWLAHATRWCRRAVSLA